MIWLALLIPVVAVAVLACKFPKRMNIVEYAVVFLVPIICIIIGKWASVHSQTHDTEFWNSYGTKAVYEERWNERVSCRHPKYRTETYRDSQGKTQTRRVQDGHEHMYDVDDHPPKWYLKDNIGGSFSISKSYFEQTCKIWEMRKFKDMKRSHHSVDGDAYISDYDKKFEHTIPLCKQHTYENRVQCSKSVFNFEEVSDETKDKYKLYDYPEENVFGFNPILGGNSSTAVLRLQKHNSLNGSRRQLHMMILVFNNQPLEASLFQESYWNGGNKNEFIVCVGVKDKKIKWTKVISWTEQEELKIKTARCIKEMRDFDLIKIVDYMGENVPKKFIRKEFVDFSYIAVRPTTVAIMITYIITLLVTLGLSLIAIFNRHDFGTFLHRDRRCSQNRWR